MEGGKVGGEAQTPDLPGITGHTWQTSPFEQQPIPMLPLQNSPEGEQILSLHFEDMASKLMFVVLL